MTQAEFLLQGLVEGIKKRAAEEDGVPDWLWDDFCAALRLLEGK